MSAIIPDPAAIKAFTESPAQGPVVMINLLKFKGEQGAAAYAEYGRQVFPMIEKRGGQIIYSGRVDQVLVGDTLWELVAIVEYPSRAAFLDMVTSAEYIDASHYRDEGLESTILCATTRAAIG